ncbi:hypothetical protein VL15_14855 [Burkholderia cepacia]|uniref:Uncharacterized protein n=1 Tax=Burkholderia cepacia TaxID=292 RepID=A0A0J5WXL3_BURCE|nr:hypothetical protein VL15_14855 [Burkholderia cepacia]
MQLVERVDVAMCRCRCELLVVQQQHPLDYHLVFIKHDPFLALFCAGNASLQRRFSKLEWTITLAFRCFVTQIERHIDRLQQTEQQVYIAVPAADGCQREMMLERKCTRLGKR